jgi:hypothetical protein
VLPFAEKLINIYFWLSIISGAIAFVLFLLLLRNLYSVLYIMIIAPFFIFLGFSIIMLIGGLYKHFTPSCDYGFTPEYYQKIKLSGDIDKLREYHSCKFDEMIKHKYEIIDEKVKSDLK